MTKNIYLILFCCFVLQSCIYWENDPLQDCNYTPVHMARKDLDNTIKLLPSQEIINSGKIYTIGNYLFVGEKRKGFHVFDNTNPLNPIKIKFIQVLGCSDIAIRNTTLYINQATDLLTLDLDIKSNKLALKKRIQKTFPGLRSPDGFKDFDVHQDSIVIDWKLKSKQNEK